MKVDKEIWKRYLQDQCTDAEKHLLESWYDHFHKDQPVSEVEIERIVANLDNRILKQEEPATVKKLKPWYIAVAASVALLIGFFAIHQFHLSDPTNNDILAPQGSNSVIVLEDNTEIKLDDLKAGDTLNAIGYKISRNTQGEVIYIASTENATPVYNTIRTKAGGLANVVLADGSHIWVNSRSEIKYPIQFTDQLREVQMSGEAYFEIAKDAERPFYVRSTNQTIRVLGTKFNVNSKTSKTISSLLEGKIALNSIQTKLGENNKNSFPILLHPGQAYNGNSIVQIEYPEQVTDWKDGYFDFSDMTLDEACTKMADWYDVSFNISDELKTRRLYGRISKEKSVKQVMNLLSQVLKISFEVKGNSITIDTQKP